MQHPTSQDLARAELDRRYQDRLRHMGEDQLEAIASAPAEPDPYWVLADRLGEANALVNDATGLAASIIAGMRAKVRKPGRRAAMSRDLVRVRRMIADAKRMCEEGKADALDWATRHTIAMPPGSGPGFARLFDEVASLAEEVRRDMRHAFNVWEPAPDEAALGEMLS